MAAADGNTARELEQPEQSPRPGDEAIGELADGSTVHVIAGHTAEILDPKGRLLIRYRDGELELAPAEGDLVLRAPRGRVVLESEETSVRTGRFDLEARSSRIVAGAATVFARELSTTATHLATHVERYELEATRIVEKAEDTFRDVKHLAQERVGRLRTLVRDVWTSDARRTYIRSDEDTAVDGKRVLLG